MSKSEKGQHIVEPSLAISEIISKLDKLSFKNFPVGEALTVLQKNPLGCEVLDPYIFFSGARYTRNLLYKSSDFELLVLCWKPGQYSPVHGHENQKCWMRVESGELEFTTYQEEPESSKNSYKLKKMATVIGKVNYCDGPATIHAVRNISDKNAVSLHLYAKPFDQCDIYDPVEKLVRKVPLSYHSIHGKLVAPEEKR